MILPSALANKAWDYGFLSLSFVSEGLFFMARRSSALETLAAMPSDSDRTAKTHLSWRTYQKSLQHWAHVSAKQAGSISFVLVPCQWAQRTLLLEKNLTLA